MLSKFMFQSVVNKPSSIIVRALRGRHGILCSSERRHAQQAFLFSSSITRKQDKPQYEYDPSTDTFRPKDQKGFTIKTQQPNYQNQNNNNKQQPQWKQFLRNWARTVFMVTGGIVWGGLIFVALFVDVKESTEVNFPPNDQLEEEVRSLVFYNLAHGKEDLARLVSIQDKKNRSEHIENLHESMHNKHDVFMESIEKIQNHRTVIELVGEPVQLCGFRVADKIGGLLQDFQNLAVDLHTGKSENIEAFMAVDTQNDDVILNTWTAECVIEGQNGLALLKMQFKRHASENSKWYLEDCYLKKMEVSDEKKLYGI
eukprot:TCONS_00022798-protein